MKNNLLKHTILFSVFVLLAQIIGLVRDLYLVRVFGIGLELDVYYMAFKIPDFLNVFYSVFLGSVVFIPLLTAAKNVSEGEVLKKVRDIGSLVFLLISFVSVILFIFMPQLVMYLVPTWSGDKILLLTELSRILLIGQFFFPIGILAGCISMVYNRPFFMAVSGFVYNFFILLGTYFLVPYFGIYGVVYSVVFGAFAFALVQVIPSQARNIFLKFKIVFSPSVWLHFIKSNYFRFVAVLTYQFLGLLLLYIAAFSGEGGVSIFSISYNVFLAFFFILGASVSTAAMPNISDLHVKGEKAEQKINLHNSLIYMFFVSIFISLFAYIFSLEIIKILYYFSNLPLEREIEIAKIFSLLILSLPFFNLIEIIRKYLYSTNQIALAGGLTIFLLVSVLFFSIFINFTLYLPILNTLCLAILISNIFCLTFVMIFLNNLRQLDFSKFLSDSWKVVFISMIIFGAYILSKSNLLIFQNNFFLDLFFRGFIIFTLFLILIYIIDDKIGKSILSQISKFLSKFVV